MASQTLLSLAKGRGLPRVTEQASTSLVDIGSGLSQSEAASKLGWGWLRVSGRRGGCLLGCFPASDSRLCFTPWFPRGAVLTPARTPAAMISLTDTQSKRLPRGPCLEPHRPLAGAGAGALPPVSPTPRCGEMNEAPPSERRPANLSRGCGNLPGCGGGARAGLAGADLAWEERQGGVGRCPSRGRGSPRRGSGPRGSLAPREMGALFPRTVRRQRKFAVRRPRPTLEDVSGLDWRGVLYKLPAGCLGGGIFNAAYCRLFLKICPHPESIELCAFASHGNNLPKIP